MSLPEVLLRRQLRHLLETCFPSDGERQAFLFDYFPQAARGMSAALSATQQLDRLFELCDERAISQALHEAAAFDEEVAERLTRALISVELPESATENFLTPDALELTLLLRHLSGILRDQGKLDEAVSLRRRALAMAEQALGPEHLQVAIDLNNLALVLRDQGNFSEAETLTRRSLTIWEKEKGPEHLEVANSLHNLAVVMKDQGKLEEAELSMRRSRAIREKLESER